MAVCCCMPAQRRRLSVRRRRQHRPSRPGVFILSCLSLLPAFLQRADPRADAPHLPHTVRSAPSTQEPAQAPALEPERPVARDLNAGESHTYKVALDADQLMIAVVEQRGVDVAMTLVGPDGVKQAEVNNVLGTSAVRDAHLHRSGRWGLPARSAHVGQERGRRGGTKSRSSHFGRRPPTSARWKKRAG